MRVKKEAQDHAFSKVKLKKTLEVQFASERGMRSNIGSVVEPGINVDSVEPCAFGLVIKSKRGERVLVPWGDVEYALIAPDQGALL